MVTGLSPVNAIKNTEIYEYIQIDIILYRLYDLIVEFLKPNRQF